MSLHFANGFQNNIFANTKADTKFSNQRTKPFDKSPFDHIIKNSFLAKRPPSKKSNLNFAQMLANSKRPTHPFDKSPFMGIRKNKVLSPQVNYNIFNTEGIENQTAVVSNIMEKQKWKDLAFLPTIMNKLSKQAELKKQSGVAFNKDTMPADMKLTKAEEIYLSTVKTSEIDLKLATMPADISMVIKTILDDMKFEPKLSSRTRADLESELFIPGYDDLLIGEQGFLDFTLPYYLLSSIYDKDIAEDEINKNKPLQEVLARYIDETGFKLGQRYTKDQILNFIYSRQTIQKVKDMWEYYVIKTGNTAQQVNKPASVASSVDVKLNLPTYSTVIKSKGKKTLKQAVDEYLFLTSPQMKDTRLKINELHDFFEMKGMPDIDLKTKSKKILITRFLNPYISAGIDYDFNVFYADYEEFVRTGTSSTIQDDIAKLAPSTIPLAPAMPQAVPKTVPQIPPAPAVPQAQVPP